MRASFRLPISPDDSGELENAVYLLLWKNGESGKFQDGYTRRDLAELVHVSPPKSESLG